MKADLTQREPLQLEIWRDGDIYAQIRRDRQDCPKYTLHDGPPYANGDIHIGHALNKILKDIVVKHKTMRGFDAPYVPGWDCHGLPVEHQLLKDLKISKHQIQPIDFRRKAAAYALKYVDKQRAQFKRLGIFGDWERPYLTLDPKYEASTVEAFASLVEHGYIFQSLKPVHWCAGCETALAEAELEYDENHASPSVTVLFAVRAEALAGPLKRLAGANKVSFAVWTTTPWTLLANVAVAVHPDLEYVFIQTQAFGVVAVAEDLCQAFLAKLNPTSEEDGRVLIKIRGSELEGIETVHPFLDRPSRIVTADYVSNKDGTGCVHTAPGHGMDDYRTGLAKKLPILMPVDEKGRFTKDGTPFEGQSVFAANPAIIDLMRGRGSLVDAGEIRHSYPTCWRCKAPVIVRATRQWFMQVDKDGFRGKLLQAISSVRWVPSSGQNRIGRMVELRPDWCLSRQRIWGIPVPVFVCKDCGTALLNAGLIRKVAERFAKEGSDSWFVRPASEWLEAGTACSACGSKDFKNGEDILDVWFESGASHVQVLQKASTNLFPADLYLEGSDQHRGWFQSSLLVSCGINDAPPYRAVLTHGFIVDSEGRKMSKSLGNVISPDEVIKQFGADILRLWVASADTSDDIRISHDGLQRLADGYRKIRNTFKYLLGNLKDFDPTSEVSADVPLCEIDRWILAKLELLKEEVLEAY
ncbi:MAG: isoleucine--tRNA ligase, partial [Candidatus Omnitrophota bacterium]